MARQNSKRAREVERLARQRAKQRRAAIRGGLAAALLLAVVVGVVFVGSRLDPVPTGVTTQTEWSLPALTDDSEQIALADFRGTPVVAAFFADWCPHCRRELPHYRTVSDDLGDQVAWVGINSQNSGGGLIFAREMGIDVWPLARDIGGRNGDALSTQAFGAAGMPLTVFYTPQGTVAHVQRGPLTEQQLRGVISDLFGVA